MDYSYVEVMKNKNRMCKCYAKATPCIGCPLNHDNNGHNLTCTEFSKYYPEEVQEIVMKWAEEHKVKTNLDVFCEVFGVNKENVDVHERCPFSRDMCTYSCDACKHKGWWQKEYKEK